METIAKQVNGKRLDSFNGPLQFDGKIYTFEDGSKAIAITKFEETEPYVASSLSTMSKKPYKIWMMV